MSHDRTIISRLLKKVTIAEEDGCWIFTGWNNGNGYGKISIKGKAHYTHRVMYEWFHRRKLRKNVTLDHECCNRACCNPLHLTPMMHKRNCQLRDKRRKNRVS